MKKRRHAMIIELIEQEVIETQEEIADKLKEAGFEVTQATVSRDIRDLKLSKVILDDGRQQYVLIKDKAKFTDKYIRLIQEGFISMEPAQNIIVIRTNVGMAMAVATAIDELHIEGLIGCIAGDDTIMCVVKSADIAETVMNRLNVAIDR